jgi:cytochrome c biogenesis protein CcmG/thiol:disulfide interchange protein DsbE
MKSSIVLIFPVLILLLSTEAYPQKSSASNTAGQVSNQEESFPVTISGIAPDFTEKDIKNNKTISLNNYRGKVVMLNFGATWCPPCREEIPALEELQETYKNKLVIIGVAVFSSTAAIEQFYKDYEINYPVIMGSYELMEKYGKVRVVPTTILIDKKGVIADNVIGSRTKDKYSEMLKPLLAQ